MKDRETWCAVVHRVTKNWAWLHWKDSNTLATSCEELTHWKRPWCWEGLGAGGEGDDRGWDGWMASPTLCTWVWVNSGSWWWTGRPGVLRFVGSQRVGHDWATELNWTELATELATEQHFKFYCGLPIDDASSYWFYREGAGNHWLTVSDFLGYNYQCFNVQNIQGGVSYR